MSHTELDSASLELETDELELQLARLLDSHHFRHSHRYPALLRFLVEQTQRGRAHLLKERLLGIEVFHRAPDYDTNLDPVVRVTAAEVRKRIAQYYQEPGREHELRIEIPTGSYVPRFHRPAQPLAAGEQPAGASPQPPASTPDPGPSPLSSALPVPAVAHPGEGGVSLSEALPPSDEASQTSIGGRARARRSPILLFRRRPGLLAALCLLLGGLAVWTASRLPGFLAARREYAQRDLWAAVDSGSEPTFIVVGDHTIGSYGNALRAEQGKPANPSEAVLQMMNEREQVTFSDVDSLFKLTGYMTRHGESYNAKVAGGVDLAELRRGPVLLFAGLDNRWTMRLSSHLRFRFVDSPDDTVGTIEDSLLPGRSWIVDFKVPANSLPTDYAIVARYFDPLIEQPVLVVAGVGATGTVSAAEFATSERMLEDLYRLAPKGWKPVSGNLEVVLAMQVMDGRPGPPHVVASQFW